MSVPTTTLLLPLTFSLAHVHHIFNLYHYQHFPLRDAVQSVAFQCTYTYVFGVYACWLLARSGSIVSPLVAHCLCNALGFPDFEAMQQHAQRRVLLWTTVGGVVVFFVLVGPVTGAGMMAPGSVRFWGAVEEAMVVGPPRGK